MVTRRILNTARQFSKRLSVLGVIALAACGDSYAGRASIQEDVGTLTEGIRANLPTIYAGLTCDEVASTYPVDPVVARSLVPPEYELELRPDGSGTLGMILQNCSEMHLDDLALAPHQNVFMWIAIQGPPEVIVVPGTVDSWPTAYWFNVNNFTTNHELLKKLGQYGFPNEHMKSLDLPPLAQVRTAIMTEYDQTQTTFTAQSNLLSPVLPFGVHHRIFSGRGANVSTLFASCVVWFGAETAVTVDADPRSFLGRLFGETLSGAGGSWTPVECDVLWDTSRIRP